MHTDQGELLFDQRFLTRYAGSVMNDPSTALVELVANAWDAYATHVQIDRPDPKSGRSFKITDNGHGMTEEEFRTRWRTLEYDRVQYQGDRITPPDPVAALPVRFVYGRNGRGRHAAFLFSSPYQVRTWKAGTSNTFLVSRTPTSPLFVELLHSEPTKGHGTEIRAISPVAIGLSSDKAREVLGSRFLVDPNFSVIIDGIAVTFDDIPRDHFKKLEANVPGFGAVRIIMIDTQRPDRTTLQHGIAWRVHNRLVGTIGWRASDYANILDGRTSEAKRYTFIVFADFLAPAVTADWSNFDEANQIWQATRTAVQDKIRNALSEFSAERRLTAKAAIRERNRETLDSIPVLGRERWERFVDQVLEQCPKLSGQEIDQLARILANLEKSHSQYSLLHKLHVMPPGELDQLHGILEEWTVKMAKIALDEIGTRVKLLRELHEKVRDDRADEVQELQPLFERGLWIFGPEFESIEFTSNKGMTTVIQSIFRKSISGSRQRPDFVITTDSTVGLYSRPSYDGEHNPIGVGTLVIVELKKPGIKIGNDQKNQAWEYVKELREKGQLTSATKVHCFVLGSIIDAQEMDTDNKGPNVSITPLLYETFLIRAEKRMLNLYSRLKEAPFLSSHGIDPEAFMKPAQPAAQGELSIGVSGAEGSS